MIFITFHQFSLDFPSVFLSFCHMSPVRMQLDSRKLMALRDAQLSESEAERRRLRKALESEEMEVLRLRGRSSELQEALQVELSEKLPENKEKECRSLRSGLLWRLMAFDWFI